MYEKYDQALKVILELNESNGEYIGLGDDGFYEYHFHQSEDQTREVKVKFVDTLKTGHNKDTSFILLLRKENVGKLRRIVGQITLFDKQTDGTYVCYSATCSYEDPPRDRTGIESLREFEDTSTISDAYTIESLESFRYRILMLQLKK